MDGYIKKQELLDFCSMGLTNYVDYHDIEEFPIAKVYGKEDIILELIRVNYEIRDMQNAEEIKKFLNDRIKSLQDSVR